MNSLTKPFLVEYRCQCGHLLFKGMISAGSRLEIKCKRCANIVTLSGNIFSDTQDDHFILILGEDGKILEASPSVERAMGYSLDEIKSLTIFDIAPMATIEVFKKMHNVMKRDDKHTFLSDSKFRRKDGSDIFLRSKFKVHKYAGRDCMMVFYKVVGSSLTFEFSKDLVDFECKNLEVCELVSEISTDGMILYVSRKLTEFFGKPSVDILGTSFFDYFDKDFSIKLKKDFEKMVDIQRSFIIPKQKMFSSTSYDTANDSINGDFNIFFTPQYHPDNTIKGFKTIIRSSSNC